MKWLVLVLMLGTYGDGSKDTFLYFKPTFETVEQCQEYVYRNAQVIRRDMTIKYQGRSIDTVYCIREDKLPKVLDMEPKTEA